MKFKVIIAGSRDFNDYSFLCEVMDKILSKIKEEIIIVSGTAPGADKLGEDYAKERGYKIAPYPAKWNNLTVPGAVIKKNRFGKEYNAVAGHMRNEQMARDSGASACVVFRISTSRNKGSNNMIELAKKYNLKLRVYDDRILSENINPVKITYINGDATQPVGSGVKVIAHICNDIGAWGKGFVMALSKRWKSPEIQYKAWFKSGKDFSLGEVETILVEPDIWVANMIAQKGIYMSPEGPPIRYDALSKALGNLAEILEQTGASVHMPRIGCGLAGGKWEEIEPIIQEKLISKGINVTVYDF